MNEAERNVRAIRGRLLSFLRAPHGAGDAQSYRYIEDGIVLVKDGRIEAAGPAADSRGISSAAGPAASMRPSLMSTIPSSM